MSIDDNYPLDCENATRINEYQWNGRRAAAARNGLMPAGLKRRNIRRYSNLLLLAAVLVLPLFASPFSSRALNLASSHVTTPSP